MSDTPLHPYTPTVCSPPPPPAPGQIGYGPLNPFTNGVYFNPDTGFWIVPDGLWNPNDSDRDVKIMAMIDDLLNIQPPLPSWIPPVCDPDEHGNYWYAGGYMPSGKYMGEGWYKPSEFYG